MRWLIVSFLWSLITTSASAQVSFRPLGDLPGGQARSQAMAISGDGRVVVGSSSSTDSGQLDEAFRWTADEGLIGLGTPQPPYSIAFGISHDGSVVVGRWGIMPFEAFRWTAAGGTELLGVLPGDPVGFPQSIAWGTSVDGSVVVGQSGAFGKAFRWTATEGMVPLGSPPGETAQLSDAREVSADGSVIVGSFAAPGHTGQAYRWTAQSGMVSLGGGSSNAVSSDGSVVVGFSSQAFRWTAQNGMIRLGDLPGGGIRSSANDVSADGSVIVGWGETAFDGSLSTTEAFLWKRDHGMVNLRGFLVSQGWDLSGWTLTSAEGISADGRTIVGTGVNPAGNPEGWIATIPEPSTIALATLWAAGLFAVHFGRSLRGRSKSVCLQTTATVFTDSYGKQTVRATCI